MKLNFLLLAALIHAETELSGDISLYLDALQSYCKDTYGLLKYTYIFNTGKLSGTAFANKWKHRNDLKNNFDTI